MENEYDNEDLYLIKQPSFVNNDEKGKIDEGEHQYTIPGANIIDKNKCNENIPKQADLKKKICKKYSRCELIKKSLKFSTINWKSQVYYRVITLISNITSFYLPFIHGKIIDSISTENALINYFIISNSSLL